MAKKSSTMVDNITPIWTQRLRALLEERNMKQSELAEMSGVSASSISDWIGGNIKREPKVKGRKTKTGEIAAAKKLAVCNFLLESMNRTDLFEFLYNYLLGEYYFNDGQQDLGATAIYLKTPNGEVAERLNFAENYAHAYLALVLQELSVLKKVTDKIRLKKQKADYFEWLKTPEGIAFERDVWEQQTDYEEDEND